MYVLLARTFSYVCPEALHLYSNLICRLLEVNGQRLYDKEDADLQQALRTGAESLRVVILRDLRLAVFLD